MEFVACGAGRHPLVSISSAYLFLNHSFLSPYFLKVVLGRVPQTRYLMTSSSRARHLVTSYSRARHANSFRARLTVFR